MTWKHDEDCCDRWTTSGKHLGKIHKHLVLWHRQLPHWKLICQKRRASNETIEKIKGHKNRRNLVSIKSRSSIEEILFGKPCQRNSQYWSHPNLQFVGNTNNVFFSRPADQTFCKTYIDKMHQILVNAIWSQAQLDITCNFPLNLYNIQDLYLHSVQ